MKHGLLKFCPSRWLAVLIGLCTLSLLGSAPLHAKSVEAAQQQVKTSQVTGMVTDATNQPLIGVTVSLVDGSERSVTDVDGMFRINVPSDKKSSLEFNYIGFKKKIVEVSGAKLLNVVLEEDAGEMEEVVVTGYSSQKKASIIGSIETIKPTELAFGTTRTLSNNLAGKLSGVIGIQRSGEPGYDDSGFVVSRPSRAATTR